MFFDGNQDKETIIINESGLYSLVLSSKLPNAKKFKRWVTSEVLPSIRKNGGGFHGRKFGSQKILFSQNGIKRQVRELHDGLEIKSNFTTWFDRMCENGLTENDYTVMWSDSKNGNAVEFEKMRITYWLLKKKKPIIQRIR